MKCFLTILLIGGFDLLASAQANVQAHTEMADLMRSNGKIYVVVAVLLTILVGLFLFMARLDKKISRLEKDDR